MCSLLMHLRVLLCLQQGINSHSPVEEGEDVRDVQDRQIPNTELLSAEGKSFAHPRTTAGD